MSLSTTTLLQPSSAPTSSHAPFAQSCDRCGADLSHAHAGVAEDAQQRISELEAQVKILTGKATAAVDKLADYEDELRQLKNSTSQPPSPGSQSRPSSINGLRPAIQSRFSALLPASNRRSTSQPSSPSLPPASSADLISLLAREQTLRQAAETRISQTNDELEELSAQLFTEANEMVAVERKARVKLEERVKVLEEREGEKKGRLEKLEERMTRIERVRALLARDGG